MGCVVVDGMTSCVAVSKNQCVIGVYIVSYIKNYCYRKKLHHLLFCRFLHNFYIIFLTSVGFELGSLEWKAHAGRHLTTATYLMGLSAKSIFLASRPFG